jgi:hypothetical protein
LTKLPTGSLGPTHQEVRGRRIRDSSGGAHVSSSQSNWGVLSSRNSNQDRKRCLKKGKSMSAYPASQVTEKKSKCLNHEEQWKNQIIAFPQHYSYVCTSV